jgi:tetratricopeptide (TPR) repeat protein
LEWIDEGPVRDEAERAVGRASAEPRRTKRSSRAETPIEVDPETRAEVEQALEPRRAARLAERLAQAQGALERERYSEARRIANSLVKELGHVSAVHEVIGLSDYRLGRWQQAAAALEIARRMKGRVEDLPVLADCYRALRRWNEVDEIWLEIREASPAPEVMAEGRIVYVGSLAERGDLRGAIGEMEKAVSSSPKKLRPHHLDQWYVLADLYDRAGSVQRARDLFKRIIAVDADFADVRDRLRGL